MPHDCSGNWEASAFVRGLRALYPPQRVMEARPIGAVGSRQPGRHLEVAEGGQVGVNGLGF